MCVVALGQGSQRATGVTLRPTHFRLVAWVWAFMVGVGFWLLARFEFTPGREAPAVGRLAVQRTPGSEAERLTLTMFAHPRCPCTAASLRELERLLAQNREKLDAVVWFYQPLHPSAGWESSPLWKAASEIPGLVVRADPEGLEARKFGAGTSGQVVLCDAQGRVLFQGGITVSRGHAGSSPGSRAIESALRGGGAAVVPTRVFGCPILTPDRASLNTDDQKL